MTVNELLVLLLDLKEDQALGDAVVVMNNPECCITDINGCTCTQDDGFSVVALEP